MLKEASTITDIHNNCDATEVELVSLISEQIPKYNLRANSVFGYNQCDWLQTPVLSPDTDVDLSPEQCEETFKYFILSGDRLSQMTRTYHDIEAVTHLLEEKERDLELAARIGQTLLQKNREITQRNELLEEQLAGALEEASQLRHEISLKEDLLNIYADDDTDSSGAPSPVKELRNYGRAGMYSHIEGLHNRIKRLELENEQLKAEQVKLRTESEDLETEEQQLVSETVKELASLRQELRQANDNINILTEELSQKNEESIRQQEEITRLLTQIVDMQTKQKQLALENEELKQHLTAANNTQYELTREVQALEDRCQVVTNMLDETKEEARRMREYPEQYGESVPFGDSLAAELECSGGMSADFQFQDGQHSFYNPSSASIQWSSPPSSVTGEDQGEDEMQQPLHAGGRALVNRITQSEPRPRSNNSESFSQRVLNTARFVNNVRNQSLNSRLQHVTPRKQDRPIPTPLAIPGSNRSPRFVQASPDSTPSSGLATPSLGRPGVPGTEDLERAIRKLALRREGARYMELEKRTSGKEHETFSSFCDSGGTITPGSSMPSVGQTPPPSCPSSPRPSRRYRFTGRSSQAPKLRIVKPLEGSVTLNQWKYLAERDHLLTALQPEPDVPSGVLTRERAVEVLSKSRDASVENSTTDIKADVSPRVTPKRTHKSRSFNVGISSSPNLETIHPQPTSSPAAKGPELENMNISDVVKSATNVETTKLADGIHSGQPNKGPYRAVSSGPGNNFASTFMQYTFTNSRVMNPTDDVRNVIPSCPQMTACSTTSFIQLAMSSSSTEKSGNTSSYLSSIHPFLSGQAKKTDPAKQVEFAAKFFSDNTRTCSTELGLAHLLKEHGIKGQTPPPSISEDGGTVRSIKDSMSAKQTFGSGVSSAFTKKSSSRHSSGSHVLWNRSLQRTFLLHSLPTQNILFNLNSRSSCKNPETPPNSPLTSTPTSSSYLLNEILSEQTPVELEVEKKEEVGNFSSNLISKLAQIGWMGLRGLSMAPRSTGRRCTSTDTTTTFTTTSTKAVSSQTTLSKSATAPGSLITNAKEKLPFASTPAQGSKSSVSSSRQSLNDKDKGLVMKPVEMDWADLHGSSGALNVQAPSRNFQRARSENTDSGGYLTEVSKSPIAEVRHPVQSSTPKADSDSEVDEEPKQKARNRRLYLPLSMGKPDLEPRAGHPLQPESLSAKTTPSTRPKVRGNRKK